MIRNHLLRCIASLCLAAFLITISVSAFVIGNTEDLEELTSVTPENSDPILGENFHPIAQNLEFSTYKNVEIQEELSGIDPDGDGLTYRITKNPARGSITLPKDGSPQFIYSPYENKSGKDSFSYVVEDSFGNVSDPATVKIKIKKPNTDVEYADMKGHPAHKASVRLAELDILVGQRFGGTYFFNPEQAVSREEFLALAMDALGNDLLTDASSTGFFDDDSIAVWAKPYVATALKDGMVTGILNESGQVIFAPDSLTTREEATVILNRLLKLSNVPLVSHSSDEDPLPAWTNQSVANLEAVGVLPENFSPSEPLSRGDVALMLASALDVVSFRDNTKKFWFF